MNSNAAGASEEDRPQRRRETLGELAGVYTPTPSPFYRFLKLTIRLGLQLFYRTIQITGQENIDHSRPTILAGNHPNSIVDPLLVGVLERRQIAFCARDGLFRIPVMGQVLSAVGAVPVRRRRDYDGQDVDNTEMFSACTAVLASGGVMAIFPEGKTHGRLQIQSLKTGIARIALAAERDRDYPLGVQIVPVALNYLVRQAFRSDIHVAVGTPIDVRAEYGELALEDERAAVKALTEHVAEALRELAIHVDQVDDERIIAQVTSIIADIRLETGVDAAPQEPAERVALVKRIVDAYHWYQEIEPERTAELRRRLEHFVDERARLGLGGERPALQHRGEIARIASRGWKSRLAVATAGAPIAAIGFLSSIVPYALMRVVLKVFRPKVHRAALFKFITGAVLFLSCYAAQTFMVAKVVSTTWATVYGLLVGPLSLFALRYVTELRLHRMNPATFWRLLSRGDRVSWLREERKRLRDELAELRDRYLEERNEA